MLDVHAKIRLEVIIELSRELLDCARDYEDTKAALAEISSEASKAYLEVCNDKEWEASEK